MTSFISALTILGACVVGLGIIGIIGLFVEAMQRLYKKKIEAYDSIKKHLSDIDDNISYIMTHLNY